MGDVAPEICKGPKHPLREEGNSAQCHAALFGVRGSVMYMQIILQKPVPASLDHQNENELPLNRVIA